LLRDGKSLAVVRNKSEISTFGTVACGGEAALVGAKGMMMLPERLAVSAMLLGRVEMAAAAAAPTAQQ